MAPDGGDATADEPWQQRLLDSEWLLAVAAIIFFALSYVVWGLIDIFGTPPG